MSNLGNLTERERCDMLINFVVRCRIPHEQAMDAIDNRMTFLPRESAEYVINFLNQHVYFATRTCST